MSKYITTLTIAGSDSSGGAGIQADLKTMSALGCYAMSVITATTAQNTCGVTDVCAISRDNVEAQLRAVLEDIPPLGIKTGMLYTAEIINVVAHILKRNAIDVPLVVDPVMVATSGDRLLKEDAVESYIHELIPIATIITPNLPEAEVLSGIKIDSQKTLDQAGKKILKLGAKHVLIKGGHMEGGIALDTLYSQNGEVTFFELPKVETLNTHGTGCTLSAAITAFLAQGEGLENAIKLGKKYLTNALKSGKEVQIGGGHGPVDHFYDPHKSIKE